MAQVTKNLIRFSGDDWTKGASPQYGESIDSLPTSGLPGNTVLKAIDPFRALGYVLPGPLPESPTNASEIDAKLIAGASGVESGTNYLYALEQGRNLHRISSLSYELSNSGSWPHAITGSGTETGDDLIEYSMNISGTRERCLFYSWNDTGANWDIGRFRFSDGSFDDDWLTTVPANAPTTSGNGKPHPMIIGADDILYVGDGNVLQAIDGATGTDGTYSSNLLTLPEEYIITSFAKIDSFLVVFAYKSLIGDTLVPDAFGGAKEATAFFWNYLDEDPAYVFPLDDDYVTCAFPYKSTMGCFTAGGDAAREVNGEDRTARLKLWDGSQFSTVKTYIGGTPTYRGVKVINDSIQWNAKGNILCYGSPYDEKNAGLNLIYKGSGTSSGLYEVIGSSAGYPVASSGDGVTGGLQRFNDGFTNSALIVTEPQTPQVQPGEMGIVKSVTVYYGETTSGGREVSVSIITDGTTVTNVISGEETITEANLTDRRIFDVSGDELTRFSQIRVAISYSGGSGSDSAPAIRWVDVEYEPITIKSAAV